MFDMERLEILEITAPEVLGHDFEGSSLKTIIRH